MNPIDITFYALNAAFLAVIVIYRYWDEIRAHFRRRPSE